MELDYPKTWKRITTAPSTPEVVQLRDTFQTPRYATDLLIPFIPEDIKYIWEPAAGKGRIADRLMSFGYYVWSTDISIDAKVHETYNFVEGNEENTIPYQVWDWIERGSKISIITNPPFSIKDKFIEKAFEYKVPFAFLINADYSETTINWIERGCEKIIPKQRINFITPNVLTRIWHGTILQIIRDGGWKECKKIEDVPPDIWEWHLKNIPQDFLSIDEVPSELLFKYSSAQFHSMWLTWGFDLGKTETFVDLPIKIRKENM